MPQSTATGPSRSRRRRAPALCGVAALLGVLAPALAPQEARRSASEPRRASLSDYDFDDGPAQAHALAAPLAEISGLAFDDRGRLFAHDDERARIHQLEPGTGRIIRSIPIGDPPLQGDFEGLAVVGARFFLITGLGTILEIEEGGGRARLLRRVATGLGARCETEGLAFDPATQLLLAPCKTPRGRALEGHLVIFAIPLTTLIAPAGPRHSIPLPALASVGMREGFHPSSVEVHPRSGALLLASAQEEALVEIARDGSVLGAARLRRQAHPQPEGIAFGPDLTLWIADEGGDGRGTLSRYPRAAGTARR